MPTDDTLSLPVILAWLRVNWGKMVLGGTLCAILALPVVLLKAKTYDAEVTLLVSPPAFKDRPKPVNSNDPNAQQATIADMMPKALPMETYKVIALSAPVLDEVIRRVPLKDIGVKALQNGLEVELVQLGSRGAQGILYTQALTFHARAKDSELAAKTAQAWAEVFKEHVDKTVSQGVNETFSLLDALHSTTMTEFEKADLALAEHTKLWNVDLLKAQVEAKQKEYTEFEGSLKQTEVELASAERKLASLESELALEPQKNVFFRAPSDDAYWIAGLDNASQSKSEPDKGLRTEEPNPNYVTIRTMVVTAKEELEGLKAKKESILLKVDELKKELNDLTATLADKTVERNKLIRESESLKASYAAVRSEYEKGRMAHQTHASDIVIAGNAVPPDVPSSPSNPKVVIFAAVMGTLLTGAFLVAKELSEVTPKPGAAKEDSNLAEKPA